MANDTFDIQQLVNASGVPRRTVYFYVQQGVLPPPEGAGLGAYYTEDHLLRLKLVPVLRNQGLRLDEIRERFSEMQPEEMRQLLNAEEAVQPVKPPQHAKALTPAVTQTDPFNPGAWDTRHCVRYQLPAGIELLVPNDLSPLDRQRLNQLLQAARQIFSGRNGWIIPVDAQRVSTNPKDNGPKKG